MAGNSVVAKPAEQTPLVAAEAVRLLHEAGVPTGALAARARRRRGRRAARRASRRSPASSSPARPRSRGSINRALAAKDGPIVPLIAETGGINAMIVDATALPEQVADDVVTSAFRSAGQRCSALRLLCVQEDVADRMIAMIVGAAARAEARRPARPGDPYRPGDRRGGEGAARRARRAHAAARRSGSGTRSLHPHCRARGGASRPLRRAARLRARPSRRRSPRRCSGRSCMSCAIGRGDLDQRARRRSRLRLRPDARHPFAHRRDGRAHRRAASASATSTSTAT